MRIIFNESYLNQDGSLEDLSQRDINEILRGYIECALWTEEERLEDEVTVEIDDEDLDEVEKLIRLKGKYDKKTFSSFISDDIDVNSRIDAYNDIKTFIKNAGDVALEEAISDNGLYRLGMDIWYTRNGHGAGFFDHSYDNEEELMKAAEKLGETTLYVDDDFVLHFE